MPIDQWLPYYIQATLLNSHLLHLDCFSYKDEKTMLTVLPAEMAPKKKIRLRVVSGGTTVDYPDIPIATQGTHKELCVTLPYDIMAWIRENFPFSAAYFASGLASNSWGKAKAAVMDKAIHKTPRYTDEELATVSALLRNAKLSKTLRSKLEEDIGLPLAKPRRQVTVDEPRESLAVKWTTQGPGAPYLEIKVNFCITAANAPALLSPAAMGKALSSVLLATTNTTPPIQRNLTAGSKRYLIQGQTLHWMDAAAYKKNGFHHPGLYLLRRTDAQGDYHYYVGKAVSVDGRVTVKNGKILHPDENGVPSKHYDAICAVPIDYDEYLDLLGLQKHTQPKNPPVRRNSPEDLALYGLEDIAIHFTAMLLLCEGKKLDNLQYRSYTSLDLAKGP